MILSYLLVLMQLVSMSHIYQGNSTYTNDVLYSYDDEFLYKGKSSYRSDILYTFDGVIPSLVLILLIM